MLARIFMNALGYLIWFNHSLTWENLNHVIIMFVLGAFMVPLIVECIIRTLGNTRWNVR